MNRTSIHLVAGILAAAFLFAPAVLAQTEDDDDVRMRVKRLVVEVDDDGHVVVDGKRLSDSSVILRVEPEDGEIEVETIEPRSRHRYFRGGPDHEPDRVRFRRGAERPHVFFDDFDVEFDMPHIREVAPLMERFRFEMGDGLRTSMEEHREVAELERESRELAREARDAEGAERNRLEAELRTQLEEIFAKKLELREERVAHLSEKLAEEREKLERRRAARDEMIEQRRRALLGEDDILDW